MREEIVHEDGTFVLSDKNGLYVPEQPKLLTLPTSGQLDMAMINAEFGRGNDLNAYRNTQWWTDTPGETGYFTDTDLGFNQFYGKRATSPIPPWACYSIVGAGGSGPAFQVDNVYLGPPHPQRVVVLATGTGDTTASPINSATFGGVAATLVARSSGSGACRAVAVFYQHRPADEYASIRIVVNNNASGAVFGLYSIYPSSPAPIDSGSGTTTGTSVSMSGVATAANGFVIGASHHRNTNGTAWGGTINVGWNVNYNSTYGGINVSLACAFTNGASGTIVTNWAGANNGSSAFGAWGA